MHGYCNLLIKSSNFWLQKSWNQYICTFIFSSILLEIVEEKSFPMTQKMYLGVFILHRQIKGNISSVSNLLQCSYLFNIPLFKTWVWFLFVFSSKWNRYSIRFKHKLIFNQNDILSISGLFQFQGALKVMWPRHVCVFLTSRVNEN